MMKELYMLNWNRAGIFALILVMMASFVAPVFAEDEPVIGVWQKEFKVGVNILQSSYSNNWNGGDKGSLVWAGNFDGFLEKQFNDRVNWRNTLKLAFGQTHQQDRSDGGDLYWRKPDKTDDIIDFESLFRMTPHNGWDPYLSFKFVSMFDDLSDVYNRSLSLNPFTFKEAAGISRSWIQEEDRVFQSRLGLAFVQNSRKFYPDAPPEDTLQRVGSGEFGAEFITEYKVGALDGRVDWYSKLSFGLPFVYTGKSTFEDGGFSTIAPLPEDIASYTTALDVDWENTFTANITKVISVSLFLRWVYDKYDNTVKPVVEEDVLVNEADVHRAIRKAGQFKQTMALGIGYTFN